MKIVESPCVRNCCLGGDDVCMGCFRTIDEITNWNMASAEERKIILKRALGRRDIAVKGA
ncbi:MAG: DUF1289 domain-containing protein [Thiotrichaceae bacterium]|nr:DUF1289 domain-containing protein [Thiotrichaceae bacterium]PCI12837.1 MAG: DUF1289 domain-containing protein [Thiotrichales bacterium]